ncbi:glycerate kinase [Chrysoperla carnea]|uniref:glycerate kinase n=1 Tax=Chrysoperla carnea TaxID=189513 RepID=UPI001D07F1F8|nr:glycerate kinase [Chrysoperla carnea]
MIKRKVLQDLKNIYLNGVAAVTPEKLITKNVSVENTKTVTICDKKYYVENGCYVVGFGKAVLGMALSLEKTLGETLKAGIISVPVGILNTIKTEFNLKDTNLRILEGAKDNLPDQQAENNSKEIVNFIKDLHEDVLLIVLISGGGSALLPLPKPPLTLSEKLAIIKHMTSAGATINELNMVRKQLSVLKGGGLAEIVSPRQTVSLIISDVIGNPLDFIASGPTVRNCDTRIEVQQVFEKYNLKSLIPTVLYEEIFSENNFRLISSKESKIEDYSHIDNYIIGNNGIALQKAFNVAESLGYAACILSGNVEGNVDEGSAKYVELTELIKEFLLIEAPAKQHFFEKFKALRIFFNIAHETEEKLYQTILRFKEKTVTDICLLMGGETTVIVSNKNGLGGRNQQLALQFSIDMSKLDESTPNLPKAILLSAGTDGIDGPTDAAGAIGFAKQFDMAVNLGIDPMLFLKENNSYNYYKNLKEGKYLIETGHTGTNVMDLHVLIITNSDFVSE